QVDALVTDLQWLVRVPQHYTLYGMDTTMEAVDFAGYRPPSDDLSEMPVALPPAEDMASHLFRLAVKDPTEDAAKVGFSYAVRPGDGVGMLAFWLGLLLLLIVVYRRGSGRAFGIVGVIGVVLGLALMIGKVVIWGLGDGEAMLAAGLLAAAAFFGWLMRDKPNTPDSGGTVTDPQS
ncbi:MAG: hypothetical protein ACI9OJ_003746, partial [Myxococcota bacterium]